MTIPRDSLRQDGQSISTKEMSSRRARTRIMSAGTKLPQAAQSTPPASESRSSRGSIGGKSSGSGGWPRERARVRADTPRGYHLAVANQPATDSSVCLDPESDRASHLEPSRRPPRARQLPPQLFQGQGRPDAPPVADGGAGPRDRPDDRARGVLRRHPPADLGTARRRRRP